MAQDATPAGAGEPQRQPRSASPQTPPEPQGTILANSTAKIPLRPAAKIKTVTDDRNEFIRNALPVAEALRKSGKPEEAKQLELAASAILQTKSLVRDQVPAQASDKEQSIKDLLANVYKAIDENPALKNMPEAKAMRQAGKKLDEDGMLNITVRNGVVVNFVSNLTDNFSRTQKVAEQTPEKKPAVTQVAAAPAAEPAVAQAVPAAAPGVAPTAAEADAKIKVATIELTYKNPEEPGKGMPDVLGKRFTDAGAIVEVVSTKFAEQPGQSVSELKVSYQLDKPGIEKVSALLDAVPKIPGGKLQEQPGDEVARKEAVQQQQEPKLAMPAPAPTVQAPVAPVVAAAPTLDPPAPAQAAAQVPTPTLSKGEVLYTSASPDLKGNIMPHVTSSHQASYSIYQIQVDPKDSNRAILLPAPGADKSILAALDASTDTAYQVVGQPGVDKRFIEVQTPTQLERTAEGWKLTEKGVMGFSETEKVYQAPQVAPVQQQAPQQQAAPPLAPTTLFTRADIEVVELARMGVKVADLEKSGQLQKLLEGQKTDLIQMKLPNANGPAIPFEAKLVLQHDADGKPSLRVDLPKHELEIPKQVMGKEITPAMQVQLQTNGVVPLAEGFKDVMGQQFAAYLTIDPDMKRIVAVPRADFDLSQKVHGVELSPAQQKQLLEGRPTRIEGMTNDKQELVSALVQLDPLKNKLTFRDSQPQVAQEQAQVQQQARRRGQGM